MKPINIGEVCTAVGGNILGGSKEGVITSITTDSRKIDKG